MCALSKEASPLGAEPGATGIDRGRDEPPSPHTREGDEGLIERLKPYLLPKCGGDPPVHAEIMKTWDDIRSMLLVDRDVGSGPRDVFETLLCGIYDDLTQAANTISRLKGEVERLSGMLRDAVDAAQPLWSGDVQRAESRSLQLEAEVKELRSALKPFARAEVLSVSFTPDSLHSVAELIDGPKHWDWDKARSLLSPAQEGLSSARASRDARSSTRPEGQSVDGGEGA